MPNRRDFMIQSGSAVAAMAILPSEVLARTAGFAAPVNVGIIGVGRQGRSMLAELQKFNDVTIKAICDTYPARLSAGQRRARGATAYADHRELLEKGECDAVIVATPTHLHKDIAIDAMQAGKHVYCEGPLAHTIEDTVAIADAARSHDKVFQVGLQGRANPVYKLAWTFYRSDSVRDSVLMRGQASKKTSWRFPVSNREFEQAMNWRLDPSISLGLAGEWGTQQFDVFHWYRSRYPTQVTGSGTVQLHKDGREVADTVTTTFRFPDGDTLQYAATLANSYEGTYEVLYGTNAAIKLGWSHGWMFKEADAPTQGWEVYANRQQFHNDEGITLIADATKLASQGKLKEGIGLPNSSLYYALEDFLESVTEGADVACTADEGKRATIVGIKAAEAVREGTTVEIDPSLFS